MTEVFPRQKPDRRFLPDIPSKQHTRRLSGPRYFSQGQADIYSADGKYRYTSGRTVDISEGGMLLVPDKPLRVGDKAVLRFF